MEFTFHGIVETEGRYIPLVKSKELNEQEGKVWLNTLEAKGAQIMLHNLLGNRGNVAIPDTSVSIVTFGRLGFNYGCVIVLTIDSVKYKFPIGASLKAIAKEVSEAVNVGEERYVRNKLDAKLSEVSLTLSRHRDNMHLMEETSNLYPDMLKLEKEYTEDKIRVQDEIVVLNL